MTDSNHPSTVLVITEDVDLLSSLLESNTTNLQFISRETMQAALDDPEVLSNNNIVIMDIESVSGGTNAVIEQALKLKKSDPTQVLMIVGESEPLGEILRSNIQPLIYRAFNKPIHPNQIFLSFGSAAKLHDSLTQKQAAGEDLLAIGPLENKTSVDTIVDQQKSKSVIYAAVGVVALAVIGWLLFGNSSDTTVQPELAIATPTPVEDTLITTDDDISRINLLNQEAAKALLEGREISPAGNNALHYYNQVLAIDPYDLTAYEGKKALAVNLKGSYAALVRKSDFDGAFATLDALQSIEPLDTSNYELREELEEIVNERNKPAVTAAKKPAPVAKTSAPSKASQAAAAALQKEKELMAGIDQAVADNIIVPPTAGNAFDLVSEALQTNSISKANLAPRISALSEKLVFETDKAIGENNLKKAIKFSALVRRLDVDPDNLTRLTKAIEDKEVELAGGTPVRNTNTQNVAVTADTQSTSAKIIPAKIISRTAPRYPGRALDREMEGWVSIGFKIDTEGVPQDIKVIESSPDNTFDSAAISAVKKWRFSPAINEQTNLPVESVVDSTKLQFRLDQ